MYCNDVNVDPRISRNNKKMSQILTKISRLTCKYIQKLQIVVLHIKTILLDEFDNACYSLLKNLLYEFRVIFFDIFPPLNRITLGQHKSDNNNRML